MPTSRYTGQFVVVFGTVSLQQYIFQSNRLKENIGASYLAKHSLGEGLIESMKSAGYKVDTDAWNRYKNYAWGKDEATSSIPQPNPPVDPNASVNIIYIGGGNAALLCENRDIANGVVKTWSRELLVRAPGLRVAVGYGKVKCSLAKAYREALNDLGHCEEALPFGIPLCSLPVVQTCTSTGLPANQPSEEPYEENQWISEAADRKRKESQNAITDELESILEEGQRFAIKPEEELGGSEGQSHIAVVHADGNGMGKWLNSVIDEVGQEDVDFLHHLRAFSASVSFESLRALVGTLKCLQTALPRLRDDLVVDTSKIFPLRPIVYGGDDLTFVCDGRLGLNLAAFYLEEFSKSKICVLGEWKSVSACAGVAIVPTKFPFARAYDFADKLCGLTKAHRRSEGNSSGSWLDFQIIQEGATRSINALRDAQYRSITGQTLHQRPYQIPEKWNAPKERDAFVKILQVFKSKWPRTRAKGLLDALVQGPDVTERFIAGARWRDVELPPSEAASYTGWTDEEPQDQTTPYFDPLEALDFYIEVKPATSSASGDEETEEETEA